MALDVGRRPRDAFRRHIIALLPEEGHPIASAAVSVIVIYERRVIAIHKNVLLKVGSASSIVCKTSAPIDSPIARMKGARLVPCDKQ